MMRIKRKLVKKKTDSPPTLRIPLFVFKVTLDLKCTGKQLETLHKNVYRVIEACESYDDADDIPGKIRASFSSSCHTEIKRWKLEIVTPPLPQHHPIIYRLEGATTCMFHSKYFVSRGSTLDEYAIQEIK